MLRRLGVRLTAGLGIVLLVTTFTFILISVAPGDPARLWVGPAAGAAELEAAREALGLDRPLAIRYLSWLGSFVRGDWGTSLADQRPVTRVIAAAAPHTLLLSISSLLLTYVVGVAIGAFQAVRRRSAIDTGLTVTSLLVYGMPAYWLAIMLVLVFSYGSARFGWPSWLHFPAMGVAGLDADFLSPWNRVVDRLRHLALPLLTLTLIGAAGTARFVRGAVIDVRGSGFITTARAKGLHPVAIEIRHVLRNALLPVVTLLGLSLPALFSGTVFVEVIFAWPGMGRVMVGAVGARDYPVVLATTTVFASLVVIGNLLADALYSAVDPRLRRGNV
ncbi:MAG: ABC transporter permease [Gemmatimonadales bacterium]|jgi:peptide/nickel transport system permease protein